MDNKLVTISYFQSPFEAHIAKGFLETNNILTFIADEHVISLNIWYSLALGRVKLIVLESDFKEAKELLDSLDQVDSSSEPHMEWGNCPECGESVVRYIKKTKYFDNGFFGMLCYYFVGYPWIFCEKYFFCESCHNKWPAYNMNEKIYYAVTILFKALVGSVVFMTARSLPAFWNRLKKEWQKNDWI